MSVKKLLAFFIVTVLSPVLLLALPQDLEIFTDFENETATGTDFTLGVAPFTIRVIGFTLETVDNPALAHSGTKALVLAAGQEGKLFLKEASIYSSFMLPNQQAAADWSSETEMDYFYEKVG